MRFGDQKVGKSFVRIEADKTLELKKYADTY